MQYIKKQIRFPKSDYYKSIEKDKTFIEMLKKFITAGNEQLAGKGMNKLQSARLAIEVYEADVKMQSQILLTNDKTDHFNNEFMPAYQKRIDKMKELWGTTLQAITGKIEQETGFDYEADAETKKEMYNKAIDLLENSQDENLKLLFAYFCDYDAMAPELKENEEVKLQYFDLFLKLMK